MSFWIVHLFLCKCLILFLSLHSNGNAIFNQICYNHWCMKEAQVKNNILPNSVGVMPLCPLPSFINPVLVSASHLKVRSRISLTSFTCCWHNLMCRYENLQQKNSNMQQKNIPFPSYSWVFCPFFNILCVLVFMVVLDMSYCLSDVGMWASSLSWQFESRGRSSHSFLMSTGSLISTL